MTNSNQIEIPKRYDNSPVYIAEGKKLRSEFASSFGENKSIPWKYAATAIAVLGVLGFVLSR